ncbi:MAG: DUF3343 domain-containing protein [Porcipelethomonas sp.]
MKYTAVSMPTVTHAIKAKRFLQSQGYKCEVRRSPKASEYGCTHVIIVNGDKDIVIALLKKHHIEYGKIISDGVTQWQ